jgi:hypothetical protein
MEFKNCSSCKKDKQVQEFMKKDKILKQCNICREMKNKSVKKYYQDNKDTVLQYHHEYSIKNKEMISEKNKKYGEKNKEVLKEKKKDYYENNKDVLNEKKKVYGKSSIDVILKNKIKNYKQRDLQYNRLYNDDDYVSIDYVKEMLIKCENKCCLCKVDIKTSNYENRDPTQFSVDRIDNSKAHTKSNIQITCYKCNCHKQ